TSGNAVSGTINGTFKNCKFEGSNGLRDCYAGETVVFENCVFDGSSIYGVHFDGGANDVIFRNCTISGFNALGAQLTLVTFENCTFVGNGKSGYNGANLWGSAKLVNCEFTFNGTTANEWIDCIGADKTYEFTNCTVNGVAYTAENRADYNIFSRNDATVKINGVDCQF
ncbi:MAG: pentapeptide repeat-containing protein, partial [Alistipes sp.]|nr:pentapeptide repeat-containing protein [Alistipes sp.]